MTTFRECCVDSKPERSPSEAVDGPCDDCLIAAMDVLATDGLLAHPTGSVYGLGGALRPDVGAELARLKGYSAPRPHINLVSSVAQLLSVFPEVEWGEGARRLADRYWPGPLTLVLDNGTQPGIAVRVDSNGFLLRLLEQWGGGMSSSSLNRRGQPAAWGPDGARSTLEGMAQARRSVLLVSAGLLPGLPASTLLSLRGGAPLLIRAGPVSATDVEECLGEVVAVAGPVGRSEG